MLAANQECWVHSQPEGWLQRQATGLSVDDWSRSSRMRQSEGWAEAPEGEAATILPFVALTEPVTDQYQRNVEVAKLLALWEDEGNEKDIENWKDFEEELRALRRD